MICKPVGSKDTALTKFWIFAPSEGPKLLFEYLLLSIIDNIYKTVSRVLLLRMIFNLDYSEFVAGISYISFVLKVSKKNQASQPFFISSFSQLLRPPSLS